MSNTFSDSRSSKLADAIRTAIQQKGSIDPEAYLGVVDSMYLKPHQVMLVAAHNGDLAAAQKCGLSTGFVHRPTEHGPNQKTDLKAEGEWNAVGNSMIELAKKIGC